MAAPRTCTRCARDFTPHWYERAFAKCLNCRRGLTPRRTKVTSHGSGHTYDLGLFGRGHHALAWQASIAGGTRTDPSKLPDGELDAIRRRHLPTLDELADDETTRIETDEKARRAYVLGYVATPTQAALVAVLDTEGDTP